MSEIEVPTFYCSRCGRKLVATKVRNGYDQSDGTPKFKYEHHCPAPLIGWMHGTWITYIHGNCARSSYEPGMF